MNEKDYVGYYTQDVEYPSLVVPSQTPLKMCLSASLSGFLPPDPVSSYTYCEICCRDATTLIALSLLNPESQFWGIEFNSWYIEKAKTRIEKYGLKNLNLVQKNLLDLEFKDFPEFDFIVISGVYSLLEEQARKKILDFVSEKLKQGGLFYVEYMALPGRISLEPLWKLIQKLVSSRKFSSEKERAKKGLYFLRLLAKRGMLYLYANPSVARIVQFYLSSIKTEENLVDHFFHHFLLGDFRAFYFYEIYEEAKRRGLEFVGSADSSLNDLELAVPPVQIPTFFEISEPELVETVKDFIRNTTDRRDLFTKENAQDFSKAYKFLKEKIKLFPTLPVTEITRVLPIIGKAKIPLSGSIYDKVFKLFEEGKSFITLEDLEGFSEKQVLKALNRLLATQEFEVAFEKPCLPDFLSDREVLKLRLKPSLNEEFLEEARKSVSQTILVSEITRGAGTTLSPLEVLFLAELKEKGKISIQELKEKLSSVNKTIYTFQGPKPLNILSVEELEKLSEAFIKRKIPLLLKLGVVEV